MADEADKTPDDELLLDDPLNPDDEGDEQDDDNPETNDEDEDEETVLTFGDDPTEPKDDDSSLIKHLREELKRARREAREPPAKPAPIEVGEKPTLSDCEYDEDKFDAEYEAWQQRKAAADRQKGQATQADETERQAWQAELDRYNDGKSKLGFADVEDAEETIKASLDTVQQAVLVKAADDPAKVMYALAKHPDRLTAIASIRDPLKMAAAIAKLEGQLKMVKRRKAPEPEKIERGSGKVSKTTDRTLAKLEAEADRTGERTALVAYKKKLQAKA